MLLARWTLLTLLGALVLRARTATAPIEYVGALVGPARAMLVQEWDAHEPHPVSEVERAYCVRTYHRARLPWSSTEGETVLYAVTDLMPAETRGASPWEIPYIRCPAMTDGTTSPVIHTHPMSACAPATGRCMPDASKTTLTGCVPSDVDLMTAARTMMPFGIVQCGRERWRFYAPPPPDDTAAIIARMAVVARWRTP